VFDVDRWILHGDDQTLHAVLQLADVPWPRVFAESAHGSTCDLFRLTIVAQLGPPDEVLGEQRDIVAALAEGRNAHAAESRPRADSVKKKRDAPVDLRAFPWSLWPSVADAIDTPYGLLQDAQEFRPADESLRRIAGVDLRGTDHGLGLDLGGDHPGRGPPRVAQGVREPGRADRRLPCLLLPGRPRARASPSLRSGQDAGHRRRPAGPH